MRDGGGAQRQAAESLWRFSLALYARPDVAKALIGLQDRAGRDVNLILFALWLGATQGRRVDPIELAAAAAAIAPLNAEMVQPLRRLRRELKGAADLDVQALRRRIVTLEIGAERQVQQRLAATMPGGRPQHETTQHAAAEANWRSASAKKCGRPRRIFCAKPLPP
jgi:uncharacterized protein (TIGR02444 family)